jgi:lysophospholipid acyltransferase (LPLAT)-like uncharacterized protein
MSRNRIEWFFLCCAAKCNVIYYYLVYIYLLYSNSFISLCSRWTKKIETRKNIIINFAHSSLRLHSALIYRHFKSLALFSYKKKMKNNSIHKLLLEHTAIELVGWWERGTHTWFMCAWGTSQNNLHLELWI